MIVSMRIHPPPPSSSLIFPDNVVHGQETISVPATLKCKFTPPAAAGRLHPLIMIRSPAEDWMFFII